MPAYHADRLAHTVLVARLKNGGEPLSHRQAVKLADEIQDAIAQALRQERERVAPFEATGKPDTTDRRDSFGMRIE